MSSITFKSNNLPTCLCSIAQDSFTHVIQLPQRLANPSRVRHAWALNLMTCLHPRTSFSYGVGLSHLSSLSSASLVVNISSHGEHPFSTPIILVLSRAIAASDAISLIQFLVFFSLAVLPARSNCCRLRCLQRLTNIPLTSSLRPSNSAI